MAAQEPEPEPRSKAERRAELEEERRRLEEQLPTKSAMDSATRMLEERLAQAADAQASLDRALALTLEIQTRINSIDVEINSIDNEEN